MTDKELHDLNRRELLQLMLAQGREADELRQQLMTTTQQLHQLEETYERLRKRLDRKDVQIHELEDILQAERTKREIELEEMASIAESILGFFDAAQQAADQYLYSFKRKQRSVYEQKGYRDSYTRTDRSGTSKGTA